MGQEQSGMAVEKTGESAEQFGPFGRGTVPADQVEFPGLGIGYPAPVKPPQKCTGAVGDEQDVPGVEFTRGV